MLRGATGSDAHANAVAAKALVFDGFRAAMGIGDPVPGPAVLVDEQYASGFAEPARALGARVVIPVERSGQDELQLEYADTWVAHVEAMAPDGVKALLRWDPDGDQALNRRQGIVLAEVSLKMAARAIPLMVEVLTPAGPPSPARTDVIVRAIGQIQAHDVEATLWKIEGLDTTEGCEAVAEAIGAGGRTATAIVLGRGVSLDTAVKWLEAAAPVDRFNGFAIGKTVWQEPMEGVLRGQVPREDGVAEIARRYRRLVDTWTTARATRSR